MLCTCNTTPEVKSRKGHERWGPPEGLHLLLGDRFMSSNYFSFILRTYKMQYVSNMIDECILYLIRMIVYKTIVIVIEED